MPKHGHVIWSVFKRNFSTYFLNPTGYVFITVFILLGAVAAFWQMGFFLNNLANLDQLNFFFPILLLFFVPALTMNAWSEERREGTDELLFTLPVRDGDIVLGKYLAVLGIYTVAILFSVSHVLILSWLGTPDLGLMFATYLGYWLTGAAVLSVGMVASLLTSNATVAFILGALFCGFFVFVSDVELLFGGRGSYLARALGVTPHFRSFGNGVIAAGDVAYFVALTGVMLYLNVVLLGRRHERGGEHVSSHTAHGIVRTASLAIAAVAACVMLSRTGWAMDATAEKLHSLQPQTRQLIAEIPEDRPVFIQAYISPDVPQQYTETRKNLINLLEQIDAVGGDRVQFALFDTEPATERAIEVEEKFEIRPSPIREIEAAQNSITQVFMGLVFQSGPEEFVIPFFDRGLPVEYELARSIRVVSRSDRKTLGVVTTDAGLFGDFDFQSGGNRPDWAFVSELRKQYDLQRIPAIGPYPEGLDAMLVVLPSSLSQPEQDLLRKAILAGTPTLLLDDPLPYFRPDLAAMLPKDAGRNPFQSQGQPPAPPKGDIASFLRTFGLQWQKDRIIWSGVNPHPAIAGVAPEIVFVVEATDNPYPFNPSSTIVSGLQELVTLYSGYVGADIEIDGAELARVPLLEIGPLSGDTGFDTLVTRNMFGFPQLAQNFRRTQTDGGYVLAIRSTGRVPDLLAAPAAPDEETGELPSHEVDVIFVADADLVSDTFFQLRRQGFPEANFDNVTFALNCIDVLAGDESFVALRKHRPKHRTLARVEALSQGFIETRRQEEEAAETLAEEQLARAQANLDEKVQELQERSELDEQTKAIMLRNVQIVENRRLEVVRANIEREKDRRIDRAESEMTMAVAGVQRKIKWWAALLPPIPPLVLAIILFVIRYQRERTSLGERQLAGAAA